MRIHTLCAHSDSPNLYPIHGLWTYAFHINSQTLDLTFHINSRTLDLHIPQQFLCIHISLGPKNFYVDLGPSTRVVFPGRGEEGGVGQHEPFFDVRTFNIYG